MVINLLCRPLAHSFSSPTLWTNCIILLTEMSSKSPGSIKWWSRCLNLNVVIASESQKMCESVSDAALDLSHSGLFTSPILNRCPFKWQCSAGNLVIIHSWFPLKFSNSRAPFAEGLLRKSLAYFCPQMDCQCSLPHVSCSYNPYPSQINTPLPPVPFL